MLYSCSKVVVGRSTPEVGSQCTSVFHQLHSADVVAAEVTVVLVEFECEVFAGNNQIVAVVIVERGNYDCDIGGLLVFQF